MLCLQYKDCSTTYYCSCYSGKKTCTVNFQIDTGLGVSIMNETQFLQVDGKKNLKPAQLKLTSYSGDNIQVLGKSEIDVQIGDHSAKLPLIIVEGTGAPLLGRQWLMSLKLPWNEIFVLP